MLNKLLKYEIRATARLFLPLYIAVIVFAGINRFLYSNSLSIVMASHNLREILSVISMMIYVTLIAGMMAMTLVVMIQRFYKNLLGDEGYLMFTLPVQTWKHILNKLLVAVFWTIISGVIAVCSIFIIAKVEDPKMKLSEIFAFLSRHMGYTIAVEMVLTGLLGIVSGIMMIYAAVALGQLFNKHRLLASFGMYIGVSTACQVLFFIFLFIFGSGISFQSSYEPMLWQSQVQIFLLYGIMYFAIVTAGCFVLTNFILKRKLNLE